MLKRRVAETWRFVKGRLGCEEACWKTLELVRAYSIPLRDHRVSELIT